jgi:hypothetical protein
LDEIFQHVIWQYQGTLFVFQWKTNLVPLFRGGDAKVVQPAMAAATAAAIAAAGRSSPSSLISLLSKGLFVKSSEG